jgi:serine/threonine protein kinase
MARRKRIDDRMLLVPGESVQGKTGQYTVDTVVGSGSYSAVYAAKDGLGRKVALKEFVPARHPREAPLLRSLFERERFVLSLVSPHPLMPGYFDGFEADNHFYLAQEFIEGKTLDELIAKTKLNNDWMLRWATQLCLALSYLHGLQIVHHDLKPANIKIQPNGRLALLDFGAARYFGANSANVPESFTEDEELYGTEGYLPPELDSDGNFSADVRTDIFALGCILYEMVVGEPPEQKLINERTSFITTPLMARKDVNLDYLKLVTTALSYNTDYRYGNVQTFIDALKPIAPPVFMISTKQLAFGRLDTNSGSMKRKFTIFNAGTGGEFTGDVKSKSPWLSVEMPAFRGAKRDMIVTADPSKITERNQVVRGTIEVWAAEKRDRDNHVINASEKWFIDCTVLVSPTPANLVLSELPSDGEPGYILRLRKGIDSSTSFAVTNRGETPTSVWTHVADAPGVTALPASFALAPGESMQVVVTAAANSEMKADTAVNITVNPQMGQSLHATVVLRSGSFVDGLRGLFKR